MPTHYHGTEAEIRALNTYIKLTRAAERVAEQADHHLAGCDLTPTQFGVLEALYHLGTLTQVELARKLLKSTGNITTVLQNLEKRGLIGRARSTDDQRYVRVSITETGSALIERIFPAHVAAIVEAMAVLTPEEQDALGRLCRKLGLGE